MQNLEDCQNKNKNIIDEIKEDPEEKVKEKVKEEVKEETTTKNHMNKKQRRPGRPRKKPPKIPIGVEGIVNSPQQAANIVELFYHNPNNFKKIIQFLHQESVTEVVILFTQSAMIWIAEDSNGATSIKLIVDGSKLNRYFCNNVYTFTINFDDLKVVGDKLDSSSYNSITFLLNGNYIRRSLSFLLQTNIKITEITNVVVKKFITRGIKYVYNDQQIVFTKYLDTEIYPLNFKIPGKYLKKMILDIKNSSGKEWEIYKDKDSMLEFRYSSENKHVHEIRYVKDATLMKVNYSNPTKLFSTAVFIDHIKPLTSFLTSADMIIVYCSMTEPLIFKISIESGVFTLFIAINIINLGRIEY